MGKRTYKLRAECTFDVSHMLNAIMPNTLKMKRIGDFPDVEVEFTSNLDLGEIKWKLAEIPDGHVMLETVDYKETYTGNRKAP